ncbi:efflux RND transporter periplasmic adaptor subunit [Rhodopseudomonas sp. P2A-2r]|uniref:efflux RND transporter periplasmic adaptor subunit n=1 Tax=unclassified Rhodopseudomonas TaxID=2638247 RepID=UPI0022340F3D|nr:HlyD family efflux transporter periplasmic adaptor subunit [Rhodopseudomonas sp. P2A-2r]UZE49985.1 HlyD family efflux transporter periplasmic adaptor subunit [Rhodopseudomonas sp. P2A-2r]
MSISPFPAHRLFPKLAALLFATGLYGVAEPGFAADEVAPRGAAVTVLKAEKSCFADIVEVAGILVPKEEIAIRPDRPGLKVAEVLVDAGETVTAGQALARLTAPDGGAVTVQASVAGLVSASSAVAGTIASGKGEALFSIIPRSEFEMVGQVPTSDLAKLRADQSAKIKIIGVGELDGKVRRVASTVEPNSQLGQVFVTITSTRRLMANSYARALIKTGESCGVSVPLTAILYGGAGTVVQVVRRQRVETRRVEVGLMSGGRVEVREGLAEGDIVVARAGAMLREGDPVRPVTASAEPK